MGMQAVDGRRSRCVGLAGVEVQKEGRSVSVLVPGTGPAATDSSEPGSRRLGLDRDLDLMDASVLYCCSQPRVQRAATRFPWAVAVGVGGGGVLCHTRHRSKGRRRKFRVQNEAQALANMSSLSGSG